MILQEKGAFPYTKICKKGKSVLSNEHVYLEVWQVMGPGFRNGNVNLCLFVCLWNLYWGIEITLVTTTASWII